jgi:acetyl-CoA decarbonylase/synthase complex subunit gamma
MSDVLWVPKKIPPAWAEGFLDTPAGRVPRVAAAWGRAEQRGRRLCRWSNAFRMNYAVDPGLYAAGSPSADSPVLVTANYKLSFDMLRRGLPGIDAWILVLDTGGINVWCAAGKGTFGTGELVRRVKAAKLESVVSHRRLILPQLGAPGIQAHVVKQESGFAVDFGPVRAADLSAYLRAGRKATAEMRTVRFDWKDRLELTPMEFLPALRRYPWLLLGLFLLFGLRPQGILFRPALAGGWSFALVGLAMILSGSFLVPLFLPWIPFRSFALKGWLLGAILTAGFLALRWGAVSRNVFLVLLAAACFPVVSSFLALMFTGTTAYTGLSGVQKEIRYAVPLYIAGLAVTGACAVLAVLRNWGLV